MKKLILAAFAGIGLGAVVTAAAAPAIQVEGDKQAGKKMAQQCAACHGQDGNSTNPKWPKLAGQHASYMYKQLEDFKAKRRENATMYGQVQGLSKKDMQNLAVYYAAQDMKLGEADAKLADLGERIYRAGDATDGVAPCMGCHGPAGRGNPAAVFPRLAGQHSEYTVSQLRMFKDDERSNDAGQMMRNIAANMSEKQIKAVASYIEGLR